jgi:hypothetical protein
MEPATKTPPYAARCARTACRAGTWPRTRPGLEAALGILTGYRDDELRRRWVLGAGCWVLRILGDASVDPRTHEVRAVKALRDAVPGLSLTAAVAFVREAAR